MIMTDPLTRPVRKPVTVDLRMISATTTRHLKKRPDSRAGRLGASGAHRPTAVRTESTARARILAMTTYRKSRHPRPVIRGRPYEQYAS